MALTGVLALQGAFREHGKMLARLGAPSREIRQAKDLDGIGSLIIPGGESTTIGKLLNDLGIMAPLLEKIDAGMPVFGTCAGLILLAKDIENSAQPRIGRLDARVRRNAFGRQAESFEADLPVKGMGGKPFPAVFIRAPLILSQGPDVDVLCEIERDGQRRAAAARQGNLLAASFHPELTEDTRFHELFLSMIKG